MTKIIFAACLLAASCAIAGERQWTFKNLSDTDYMVTISEPYYNTSEQCDNTKIAANAEIHCGLKYTDDQPAVDGGVTFWSFTTLMPVCQFIFTGHRIDNKWMVTLTPDNSFGNNKCSMQADQPIITQ